MMMKQAESETSVFMNVNDEEQSMIRLEFKQYFQVMCVQMALAKKLNEDYDTAVSLSPNRQRSDSEDSPEETRGEE